MGPGLSCRGTSCHVPGDAEELWEGPRPALFQLYPEEGAGSLMEKSLGCGRMQLSYPGSVFDTVKTCCVFSLKINFLPERSWEHLPVLPSLDLARAGSLQPALRWPCGWMWAFLGITGLLECHAAPWPLTPPLLRLCGCLFPTK